MKAILGKCLSTIAVTGVLLIPAAAAQAQEDIVEKTLKACKTDIETYCSQVTPGDGRLLACFVAHEDKISGQCSYALYQAMSEFEAYVNALNYLASSCWDDIADLCGDVELGEGRVARCLLDNEDEVTPECQQAMADVELEVVE